MTKPTKWHVRPTRSQISLGIRPVWSVSSQCAQWAAKDSSFIHADSEGSDQTGRGTCHLWVLSWGGLFYGILGINGFWALSFSLSFTLVQTRAFLLARESTCGQHVLNQGHWKKVNKQLNEPWFDIFAWNLKVFKCTKNKRSIHNEKKKKKTTTWNRKRCIVIKVTF